MKLKFTHKTWYFFLLCAAAASMLNGFAVLGGMDFSFLEMVAFCITGITILFLAAEKGSDPKDKRSYFLIFVLLMLSYVLNGWAAYLFSALVWPALLALEYQKGRPIQRQLQLVGAAEAFHLLFVLLTVYGGMAGLSFWANLLWVLLAWARAWAHCWGTPPSSPRRGAPSPSPSPRWNRGSSSPESGLTRKAFRIWPTLSASTGSFNPSPSAGSRRATTRSSPGSAAGGPPSWRA
mgnify:CR=1 FL=1